MEYRNSNGVVYRCRYRVAWCPKYRRKVLVGRVASRFEEIARQVASETGFEIAELEVMPDNVRMLVDVDPRIGVHRAVKRMKGRSSRELRSEFPHLKTRLPTLWTNSYFVCTLGAPPAAAVDRYVEMQKTDYGRPGMG